MSKKQYKTKDKPPMIVSESAVAYSRDVTRNVSTISSWNPNVPFHGTQEEWRDHFQRIEQGEFMTSSEYKKRFAAWKKDFLVSRMK